jgi:hexosaminidase
MEAVKLNVFHWHLSDNQGFRVESKKFPLLQEKGSDGLYYTQEQVRQLIEYARDRGIRVVPEFDMPCHTTSWFVGYPQLASGKGPYDIERHFGIFDPVMDPTKPSTYSFLDSFIGEMAGLFPDAYFHVGGDECNGEEKKEKEWDTNPDIQTFMRNHGMHSNEALQAYFTVKIQDLVAAHGKIAEGWDEVLQPGTPKDVVIQSWRSWLGQAPLALAAKQGNRGVLSVDYGYDLELNHSTAELYLVDPLGGDAAGLTPEQQSRVLGGEATLWSELISPANMDKCIWPRTAAIAERLWSPPEIRDVNSMYQRLAVVSQKLEAYGLNPRAITDEMLRRMSGESDPVPLKVLSMVVEPLKGYPREDNVTYSTFTPLNRLVDAVPPESDTAREFNDIAKRIVVGTATPDEWQQAREWLVLWRDNDAKLQPSLAHSSLTAELAPVSHGLNQVAIIGLQAMDDLQNHRAVNVEALQRTMDHLKAVETPQVALLLAVKPSVELLVQATGRNNSTSR